MTLEEIGTGLVAGLAGAVATLYKVQNAMARHTIADLEKRLDASGKRLDECQRDRQALMLSYLAELRKKRETL
jgi:uncharacterized protein